MQLTIQKLIFGGSGLGEYEGKKVFVPFSAPGDVLEVKITAEHADYSEAEIVSIIKPSDLRVTPPCPVFGRCGGCQWQHISYAGQLKWKRILLEEALARIGKVEKPAVFETLASPKEWHYRNRIQLHVDSKGRIGFYRPKSKEVIEFDECAIANEKLNEELNRNRKEFSKRDRGIALRMEEGPAFSQINTEQNENLKKLVKEWLKEVPHDNVLELYAGAGNFTFAMAQIAGCVIASDIDGRAIAFAKERQLKEGVCNIEFICAPAHKAIKRFDDGCDAVLIDPPRKGSADSIDAILRMKPKTILYISCDPATLARDGASIISRGYKLEKTQPVDMFPQTFHIESLNLFKESL